MLGLVDVDVDVDGEGDDDGGILVVEEDVEVGVTSPSASMADNRTRSSSDVRASWTTTRPGTDFTQGVSSARDERAAALRSRRANGPIIVVVITVAEWVR